MSWAKMPSSCAFSALASVCTLIILCGIMAERASGDDKGLMNLVENGDFEELVDYFPAGVLVRRRNRGKHILIPHWNVSEHHAPVEIINSRFWQSSISAAATDDNESHYAVHLNTRARGPGGVQQEFPSPWSKGTSGSGTARYELSVDVAGNPNGGSSVKRLEVVLSPSKCLSHKLSVPVARNANSKRLNWRTERLLLEVRGSGPVVTLKFQSLTPGASGPFIDNVRLVPLPGDDLESDSAAEQNGVLCRNGNDDEEKKGERHAKTLASEILEITWMSAETWIRKRFFRRKDW